MFAIFKRESSAVNTGESWDTWFDGGSVTDDFMNEREQPDEQEREIF